VGLKIAETPLAGLFVVEPSPIEDARGCLARTYCREAFLRHGLHTDWPQCNACFNTRRGTLRGMHFQREPFWEPKLVRCTRGAIYEVALDLRPSSPTFRRWFGITLSAENRTALYLSAGFAQGVQSLTDASEVFYLMGQTYQPEFSTGFRWNDPAFGIEWPVADPILSDRDKSWPDFVE
jgi:dTDP-4-dehydrorhamnose 3,5-epimerase